MLILLLTAWVWVSFLCTRYWNDSIRGEISQFVLFSLIHSLNKYGSNKYDSSFTPTHPFALTQTKLFQWIHQEEVGQQVPRSMNIYVKECWNLQRNGWALSVDFIIIVLYLCIKNLWCIQKIFVIFPFIARFTIEKGAGL